MSRTSLIPYLLIIAAGVIWGSTFTLTLIATADGTAPVVLASVQVIICSMLFLVICKGTGVAFFLVLNLKYYTVLAILGIVAPNLLYFSAAPHLSAGVLSITVSTVPMMTYILAWSLKFEPLLVKRVLGIILGMVAIMLLAIPEKGLGSADSGFWTLVILLCAVCYSIENIYISEGIDPGIDVRELLAGSNVIAAVGLVPVMLLQGHTVTGQWMMSAAGWAILGISISSTLAYMMFFYTIKVAGPVFASQCAYIVTLSGVFWGIMVLSETHSVWVWVSVATMMAGLVLVNPRARISGLQGTPGPRQPGVTGK